MAFRQIEAEDEEIGRDGGDRLAGQNDGAIDRMDLDHAPRAGRQHRALVKLLGNDRPFRLHGGELGGNDIHRGFRVIQGGLGHGAGEAEALRALQVDFRLMLLGKQRRDAAVDGDQLQRHAVVGDDADDLACGDAAALVDGDAVDGAAGPRPGDEGVDAFHRAEHGFQIVNLRRRDGEGLCPWPGRGQRDQHHRRQCRYPAVSSGRHTLCSLSSTLECPKYIRKY